MEHENVVKPARPLTRDEQEEMDTTITNYTLFLQRTGGSHTIHAVECTTWAEATAATTPDWSIEHFKQVMECLVPLPTPDHNDTGRSRLSSLESDHNCVTELKAIVSSLIWAYGRARRAACVTNRYSIKWDMVKAIWDAAEEWSEQLVKAENSGV